MRASPLGRKSLGLPPSPSTRPGLSLRSPPQPQHGGAGRLRRGGGGSARRGVHGRGQPCSPWSSAEVLQSLPVRGLACSMRADVWVCSLPFRQEATSPLLLKSSLDVVDVTLTLHPGVGGSHTSPEPELSALHSHSLWHFGDVSAALTPLDLTISSDSFSGKELSLRLCVVTPCVGRVRAADREYLCPTGQPCVPRVRCAVWGGLPAAAGVGGWAAAVLSLGGEAADSRKEGGWWACPLVG